MNRVLEPEIMDTEDDAREYDSIDHGEVNRAFCRVVIEMAPLHARVIDLGTGTAKIPLELIRERPDLRIAAVDLSQEMLALAKRNLERAKAEGKIELHLGNARSLDFPDHGFDLLISNSTVHHSPDPLRFFTEARRVLKPTGVCFIKDLSRPEDEREVERLVNLHAKNDTPYQRQLFRQSLRAALRPSEVKAICEEARFGKVDVQQTSDRHWELRLR